MHYHQKINKEYNVANKISLLCHIFIILSIGFLAIGYGMIMTFICVFLKENGTSDMLIGLINAAFFLGAMASSIFSQKIISTVGHIRSFVTFASLMVITFLLHSLFLNEFFGQFYDLSADLLIMAW